MNKMKEIEIIKLLHMLIVQEVIEKSLMISLNNIRIIYK